MKYHTTYHDNGNKDEEGFYKDGKREGKCISYYENGDKQLVSYFNRTAFSNNCKIYQSSFCKFFIIF